MSDVILKPPGKTVEAWAPSPHTFTLAFAAGELPAGTWTARVAHPLADSFEIPAGFDALDVAVVGDSVTVTVPPSSALIGLDVQLQALLNGQELVVCPWFASLRPGAPTTSAVGVVLESGVTVALTVGGIPGLAGTDGTDGVGVPAGGTTGQLLAKASDVDFDDEWIDPSPGAVTSINGQTGDAVLDAGDVGADPAGTAAALVGGLADVATTGDYSDLGGTPTLGTAAGADTGTGPTNVILGDDARLTDDRTPDPHAVSHAVAGTDPVTLTQAQITGLVAALAAKALASDLTTETTARTTADTSEATARASADAALIPLTQKAAVNGVASLDGSGLIPAAQLPAVAISDTFVVASQAAMLALTAQRGDVAVRTDLSKAFILSTDSPGTLADWKELLTPASAVTSVNTRTGAVTGLAEQTALDTEAADRSAADDLFAVSLSDEIAARLAMDVVVSGLTTDLANEATERAGVDATLQPLNTANLSMIAALTTTPYGRSLLEAANAAALRTLAALGTLATLSSVATANLDNNAVTNAKAAQMPANTVKGNNTGGTANQSDLTVAQLKTLLAIAAGDVSGLGALATLSAVGSAQITDGSIVDADINAAAAIALTKLATNPLARANHTGTQAMSTISDAGALATLSTVASAQITDGTVTNTDLANMATQTIKARTTAGTGPPEDLTVPQTKTLLAIASGDVSGLGGLATLSAVGSAQITDGSVANADLANMATQTIKGRTTAGTGVPEDLTAAQLKAILAGSDVQTFVASGTWTKPTDAVASSIVEVHVIGGGGGGGSGRKGAAGTVRCGGGGGGGAGYALARFIAGDLPATLGVTVGAAGSVGAAQATNSTNGNAGGVGGDSYFGDTALGAYVVAPGGTAGSGGSNAAGAGGGTTQSMFSGGAAGSADTSGLAGNNAANTGQGSAGGGSGAGITTGNASSGGGNGGRSGPRKGTTAPAGGTANNAGTAATSPTATAPLAGNGAGGGGSSTSGAGGGGGAGILGSGGGGGGAAVDATGDSGAGGAGGAGLVVVVTRI